MKLGFINYVFNKLSCSFISHNFFVLAFGCLFFPLIFTACGKSKTELVGLTFNGETTPIIHTENVLTLISDSGITRYRIQAKVWDIYDKAKDPYWYFPEKIYVERFDSLLSVDANVEADTAYFYKLRNLWHLIGNVKVLSMQGDRFDTSELFWDQRTEQIYTDKFVYVRQKNNEELTGVGFHSNQEMTRYSFYKPSILMNIREEEDTTTIQ
jgi:LPS export ABC transporter protein LptC